MVPICLDNVKSGLYLIDEYGNIWSNQKQGYLCAHPDKDGYLHLILSNGSRNNKTDYRVATLVALCYIGKPPKTMADPTINHIDGNIQNNYYKNLEWMERGINSSIREHRGAGSENHEAILNEDQVNQICDLIINTDLTYTEIANKFQVDKSTISKIKNNNNWSFITQNYDFSCRVNGRNSKGHFRSFNLKFHPELRVD